MSSIRDIINDTFLEVRASITGSRGSPIEDDAVLNDTGIDSLGFAMIVVRLEERLGFDPFTESDDPYYPRKFSEFVAFYEASARSRPPASGAQ